MAEKVTVMVLKVDLQCSCCYQKIKNILCNCPKIRGQIFDVKQNTVTINVVCCSPEKVRDKLICKAGKIIKSIEIKPEKKPPSTDGAGGPCAPRKKCLPLPPPSPVKVLPPPQSPVKDLPPPQSPVKDLPPPLSPAKELPPPLSLQPPHPPPTRTCCEQCSEGYGGGPCYRGGPPVKDPDPVQQPPPTRTCCGPCSEGYGGGPCYHGGPLYPPSVRPNLPDQRTPPPARTCCGPCSEGYGGGPCYQGYPAPPPCYDIQYGYGSGCRCGLGRGYQLKCVCYIEENPSPECNIM